MTPRALHAPARLAGLQLLRTQTDERLVDLVRAGNDGAFEAIVARYRRPLLRYCAALLPESRAEDAVQQTFLRALDGLRASNGEMALRPWLYRIAHNVSLNALRDRSLRHEELSEGIDGVERPDQAFERTERLRITVAAVGALPERQRDAMVLRELEGRSYDEIAAELGVTDGAVRQLLNRARGTLRAGVTAVTPYRLLTRMPFDASGGGDLGVRVAELSAAGAGGALLTKACATVLVTGAAVGGVASVQSGDGRASERGGDAASGASGHERRSTAAVPLGDGPGPAGSRGDDSERSSSGPGSAGSDRSGPGSGSGSGGSGSDSSGPGSGGSGSGSDSSGSGSGTDSSGSGSSGSGSGSGGSGSDSSGTGSSGSGISGSGTSGSGSTGSGISGSGTSGSGSSGSGSGSSGSDSYDSGSSGSGSGSSGSGSGRTTTETE